MKVFEPGAKQLQIDLALLISVRTEECQFTSAEYIKKTILTQNFRLDVGSVSGPSQAMFFWQPASKG